MEMQSGREFRRTLTHLSKHIDSSTLEDLKYICQDDIGAAKLEKVKTPLDLFRALEESGKISMNDASYLADILEAEKKYHLAEKLVPFRGGHSSNSAFQEHPLSNNQPQHLQQNTNVFDVPENQLNTYRLLLKRISSTMDLQQLRTICYLSQEAEYAGIQHRANLNGITLLNFFEQSLLISPKNLQYLRDLLHNVGRLDLCQWIDQYNMTFMRGQPVTLNKPPPPTTIVSQHHGHATAPPYGDHHYQQQQMYYDDTRYAPGSLNTIQSSHSIQVQDQQGYSIPTQVQDDDDTGALTTANQLAQVREQRGNLESVRGSMDDAIYQNKLQQLEQREMQCRRELEQKDRELQEHQKQLKDREDTINQITQQYKQQLHILRQVKTDSAGEQERLQQQIREYEEMIRQNVAQIETLREENALVPTPLGPVAEKYPMKRKPHGIAVIINNFEFYATDPSNEALPNRRGSQVDEENLRVTWEYLRYDVRILRNLTASELTRQLMHIALQSHENYDSFVCCILSHGYLDGIYGTDSQPVKINDIASLFKGNFCPTLSNKPKLFFIQACRGDDEDKGVAVQADASGQEDALRHSLPSEADFLFGYATPPGNVSWRSPRYGSWYISKLCEVLVDNSPQQDLLSMLTMVNSKVSEAYTTQGYKQCPAPVTLLRKQVWFFPAV